jgi:hypothetical protein
MHATGACQNGGLLKNRRQKVVFRPNPERGYCSLAPIICSGSPCPEVLTVNLNTIIEIRTEKTSPIFMAQYLVILSRRQLASCSGGRAGKRVTGMIKFVFRCLLGCRVKALTHREAMEWLETTGKSLVRWGDGETAVLRGRGIHFQAAHPALAHALGEILAQDRPDIAIGVPVRALSGPVWEHFRVRLWLRTRMVWARYARSDRLYVDAFMFRDRPAEALDLVLGVASRRGWVLVVSSNGDDLEFFRRLVCPCDWIGIPAKDAFQGLGSILSDIRAAALRLSRVSGRDDGLVLISAGPTAKVLIADLAPALCCYDVGHLFHFQRHPQKKNAWPR